MHALFLFEYDNIQFWIGLSWMIMQREYRCSYVGVRKWGAQVQILRVEILGWKNEVVVHGFWCMDGKRLTWINIYGRDDVWTTRIWNGAYLLITWCLHVTYVAYEITHYQVVSVTNDMALVWRGGTAPSHKGSCIYCSFIGTVKRTCLSHCMVMWECLFLCQGNSHSHMWELWQKDARSQMGTHISRNGHSHSRSDLTTWEYDHPN